MFDCYMVCAGGHFSSGQASLIYPTSTLSTVYRVIVPAMTMPDFSPRIAKLHDSECSSLSSGPEAIDRILGLGAGVGRAKVVGSDEIAVAYLLNDNFA